ncbi:AraC family transcriptional regulator [Rhizobium sp. ZK1]|uniref:AraC family transcriptional regulator n=1 Tax=Rhizobium sp. ZK1 TaxID=3389872 RepID=UPI0039F649E9
MIVQTQSADVLSDILATVQAQARCSISLKAGGSWGIDFPMPSHLKFNAVRRGLCWLRLDGQDPIPLQAGDCVVVVRAPFTLSSEPEGPTIPAREVFASDNLAASIGDGDDFSILGGSVEVDGTDGVLLTSALPPVMTIRSDRAASIGWLLAELDREWNNTAPGARLISNDLLRMIFVQVLRIHLASESAHAQNWLSGLANINIARALHAIHGNPAHAWTVESLAHEAGQSRSAFAGRFKALLGEAPMEYLTKWRMRLAATKLRTTSASITEIAIAVGYNSDTALSATFRRIHQMSPAQYRRAHQQ